MNRSIARIAAVAGLSLAVALPATGASAASKKTQNALLGAAVGALAGTLISRGDTTATLGGAAAGALIGSAATNNRYDGRRAYQTRYVQPDYGYGRGYRVNERRYDGGWDRRGQVAYYGDYGYYGR